MPVQTMTLTSMGITQNGRKSHVNYLSWFFYNWWQISCFYCLSLWQVKIIPIVLHSPILRQLISDWMPQKLGKFNFPAQFLRSELKYLVYQKIFRWSDSSSFSTPRLSETGFGQTNLRDKPQGKFSCNLCNGGQNLSPPLVGIELRQSVKSRRYEFS